MQLSLWWNQLEAEYKVLGNGKAAVYGTNQRNAATAASLNPFAFPAEIHILEHIDRLVEIF